jgi:hypothetical protein
MRSLSQSSLSYKHEPKIDPSSQKLCLSGTLSKKFPDKHSAEWDGLSLSTSYSNSDMKKSPMRWKEYETTKRTVIPSSDATDNPKSVIKRYTKNFTSNITEMINNGFSDDRLGKMTKRVMSGGKLLAPNAMSSDNQMATQGISKAYKEIHTGKYPSEERRQKFASDISKEKKVSQISTLPGGHIDKPEKTLYRKIKPQISCIFDFSDKNQFIETQNPCIKLSRNTVTSAEKNLALGPAKERKGPKRDLVPNLSLDNSDYHKIGSEFDVSLT